MKISLYTITLNGGYYKGDPVPLLDIFPLAKQWGYDGIEIESKRPHGCPLDLDEKARGRIREAAEKTGVVVSCIGSYNDFSSPIDEHLTHGNRSDRQKMLTPRPPPPLVLIGEPQIGFMHQRRRLQRMRRVLIGHFGRSHAMQFVVNQRQQLLRCGLVALLNLRKNAGHVAHETHCNLEQPNHHESVVRGSNCLESDRRMRVCLSSLESASGGPQI